jgi:hypothetical protein
MVLKGAINREEFEPSVYYQYFVVIRDQVPISILSTENTIVTITDRASYRFLNDQPFKPLNLGPMLVSKVWFLFSYQNDL